MTSGLIGGIRRIARYSMMFKSGDLVEVKVWDPVNSDWDLQKGFVVGKSLPHDFTMEEGVQVLLEGEKKYIRIGDCRCVNDE